MLKLIIIVILCSIYLNFSLPLNDEDSDLVQIDSSQLDFDTFNPPDLKARIRRSSNGKTGKSFRWKKNTVPYFIDMIYYTEEHAAQIDKAIELIENATCIRFVEHTNQRDFVTITGDADHCSSNIGRQRGEQFIKLLNDTVGEGCFRIGSVMHEMMHMLGFYHMHKTPERDDYITIKWENVDDYGHEKLIKRTDTDKLTNFGLGYDFDSLLHYDSKQFSLNGEDTLVADDPADTLRMGQRLALSEGDILRINRMYKCDAAWEEEKAIMDEELKGDDEELDEDDEESTSLSTTEVTDGGSSSSSSERSLL